MLSPAARVGAFLGAYFAANALSAFLPLFLADRHLSASDIGHILGAATLLKVLSGPGWGDVADRIGRRRPVLIFAGAVAAGFAVGYTQASGFLPLLLIAAAQGIAASAINPLADSLALALARENRLAYGPVRSIGSASFMMATALAGWLLSRAGSWIVPWLLAVFYGATTLLGVTLPEARAPQATWSSPGPHHGLRQGAHRWTGLRLFRIPAFRLAVMATALIQGAHAAYYGFVALFWRTQGLSDTSIGLLIAEGIVAEILLFARGRRLAERLGPAGLTGCAATASVLRWLVIAAAPPLPVLVAVQPLHAATFAMQHLSAMMLLSRSVPENRAATAQSLHSALGYGAPTGLMMLLAGWLYAHAPALAFGAMAMLGGGALGLVRPLARIGVAKRGITPSARE